MENIKRAVGLAKNYASTGEYEYSRAFEKIAWEQALTDIALGATNAQELAREALKTKSIKFIGKGL